MKPCSSDFRNEAHRALGDDRLQQALAKAQPGFVTRRREAFEALPEEGALRAEARHIKEHTLAHWRHYLELFEKNAQAAGAEVHWARTGDEACQIIVELCRNAPRRGEAQKPRVTKGKSMVAEEIALNEALEAAGFEVIETDLGEYIIQLAGERPSHIVAPAMHKTRAEIADLFDRFHQGHRSASPSDGRPQSVAALVQEARQVLREPFLSADVGITGANLCIAETGSTVIVTNEGNGDLTATLPQTQIVITSIEKIVPTLEDATVLLRLLSRSATGQELTAYTTFFTGPRRVGDPDGPEAFHIVLLDNERSKLFDSELREMLHCIRCGACMNHCPVYTAVGGHAYGWVYPGPMGSVLTPLMVGLEEASVLPNASTLCGRCEQVCPMSIPLPRMLRSLRAREHEAKLSSLRTRWSLRLWSFFAHRPRLYAWLASAVAFALGRLGRSTGGFRRLPLAAGWTHSRDFPAPEGETFTRAFERERRRRR